MSKKRFKLDPSSEQENFATEIMALHEFVRKNTYDIRAEAHVDSALIVMTRHDRVHQVTRSIQDTQSRKKRLNHDIPRNAHDTLVYVMEEIVAMEEKCERDLSDKEIIGLFWDKIGGKRVREDSFVKRINAEELSRSAPTRQ